MWLCAALAPLAFLFFLATRRNVAGTRAEAKNRFARDTQPSATTADPGERLHLVVISACPLRFAREALPARVKPPKQSPGRPAQRERSGIWATVTSERQGGQVVCSVDVHGRLCHREPAAGAPARGPPGDARARTGFADDLGGAAAGWAAPHFAGSAARRWAGAFRGAVPGAERQVRPTLENRAAFNTPLPNPRP